MHSVGECCVYVCNEGTNLVAVGGNVICVCGGVPVVLGTGSCHGAERVKTLVNIFFK